MIWTLFKMLVTKIVDIIKSIIQDTVFEYFIAE